MGDQRPYALDPATGVWRRLGAIEDFGYSDGEAVEEEVYGVLRSARDLRSGSEELARCMHSWSMECDFSPDRANLLRPFDWRGRRVLEVGPGCGALTRYLGEQGAIVSAVEGSLRRARITAARCRDLDNVTIYCDSLRSFEADRAFDAVVVVGVLEYAPTYIGGRDPTGTFVGLCRRLLKPRGALLVGIENQLGLKYFAGVAEDHTGELFYGIQDRYAEHRRLVTFGRAELTALLRKAGFGSVELLYPFPDYKVPTLLLTHEALTSPELGVGQMIARTPSRDGGWPRLRLFGESAAWEVVCRNGLAPDLANSFLAVASADPVLDEWLPKGWLGAKYRTPRRYDYRTTTTFTRTERGMRVARRLLHDDATGCFSSLVRLQVPSESAFIPGPSLHRTLARSLSDPAATCAGLCAALVPWAVHLETAATAGALVDRDALLPADYLDCVPWNLILADGGGEPTYVGAEWEYVPPLKAWMPFVHGMINLALASDCTADAAALRSVPYGDLLVALAERLGLRLARRELVAALEAEADWVSDVLPVGREEWLDRLRALMETPLAAPRTLPEVIGRYQARLAELTLSVERKSWAVPERVADLDDIAAELDRAVSRAHPPAEGLET